MGSLSSRSESGEEKMSAAGLSEVSRSRITEVLDFTYSKPQGFTVKYEDDNPVATITFSSSPECQFVINSTFNGAFTTSECPGIHSDAAETFQRNDIELCIRAIKEWVERIIERQKDWMLDEFGGIADSNPSYN